MDEERKKIIIYALLFLAVMAASLLFSLGIDKAFRLLPKYPVKMESSGSGRSVPIPDDADSENGISGCDIESGDEGKDKSRQDRDRDSDASVGDIRISDESIRSYYESRDRGNDLEDRYDRMAVEASFGEGCEDIETDRIALAKQLRGFLENTDPDGKDIRAMSFYKVESEYFVTVDTAGGKKDFHILSYDGAYDFEPVYMARER